MLHNVTIMDEENLQISSKNSHRSFKLLVRDEIFLIDAEWLSKLSPIFAKILEEKDFENGELLREIVDESSADIADFLQCLKNFCNINNENFKTIIRLAKKYQIECLINACENYIRNQCDINMKANEALSMLIIAFEEHLKKDTIKKLIERIAHEDKTNLQRMKIGRVLNPQVYFSFFHFFANLNVTKINEIKTMNKHLLKQVRNKIQYKRAQCDFCKKITDSAFCEGCKLHLCHSHWTNNECVSDYANQILNDLKSNLVEFEWNE
ncbi:unnamed protein product [Dracunculus medinensis]|uniref:BTB domain-containing protein n=1 Tax=Dracunculus medinensis TaxID=318479 RepID=A0A3P7SYP1_DRAME|nr:unnamed protein product [Dracunculus medinensis]